MGKLTKEQTDQIIEAVKKMEGKDVDLEKQVKLHPPNEAWTIIYKTTQG